jgi:hypothetical protein
MVRGWQSDIGAGPGLRPSGLRPLDAGGRGGQGLTRGAPGRVGYATTPERARTGSATVVLASGALMQVTAGRTPFWADVAPLVGRGMGRGGGLGRAIRDKCRGKIARAGIERDKCY